ncbi:uncharacterized protein G2W53_040094 [Senna tora]|uniref:Uncharacterized protein n=1 Tax=Senna tora TaxID=362788 RepID=A0A834W481_9FABA|nr:uncharacterized protein G2W53_040094 [Senna tora]
MMLLLKVLMTSMEGDDDGTSYAVATSKEGVNDAATKGSGDKHGRFQLHARKESTMALSKVPVTCVEGVIDGTKVLATCMEEFNDVTTNGSRDKCERVDDVTHPSWCSACEDSKDEQEDEVECKKLMMVQTKVLPASMEGVGATKDSREQSIPLGSQASNCEQRQQGRARGCVEGFGDGATEDSYNHVKLLPCSDIPPCDNKEMLKVIMSVDFSLKTKIFMFLLDSTRHGGSHERNSSLIFVIGCYKRVANNFRHLECQKVHHFTLPGFLPLLMLHLRHVEGCFLLKSTSTLNLAVLVSCTLLAGGSRWFLFFCCYKVVGLYPSAPSSLCSPYAWTPQFFVLA